MQISKINVFFFSLSIDVFFDVDSKFGIRIFRPVLVLSYRKKKNVKITIIGEALKYFLMLKYEINLPYHYKTIFLC